jgi:GTP-binding protein HflX
MFATLDPTIRAIRLPSRRRVLLSDTVGFVRDLPPDLIAAFRATLEEVQEAALILQVSGHFQPVSRGTRRRSREGASGFGSGGPPAVARLE